MDNRVKTQQEIEQEMLELNEQFADFLHTKGIKAKFKLAFNNMSQSAQKQHEIDKAEFEVVKVRSEEENKEFAEFLRTKGMKAKYNLVVENIKKGAKDAPRNTATQIAKIQVQTQEAIAHANELGKTNARNTSVHTAVSMEEEFNAFLKSKGLDGKYSVSVTEK